MFSSQSETPGLAKLVTEFGAIRELEGSSSAADSLLRQGERMFRKLISPNHVWLSDNLLDQAILAYHAARYDIAEAKVREALGIYARSGGKRNPNYPAALGLQGLIWNKRNRSKDAEAIVREALLLQVNTLPSKNWKGPS